MRRIAIINQKGGVGKTTTTVNLGAALALQGRRVVVVDMDAQANMTLSLGLEAPSGSPSSYTVLTGASTFGDALRETRVPGLRALPANIDLSGAELELASAMGREFVLRDALNEWVESERARTTEAPADYVLFDCPPSLGLLAINALAAAGEVLVTIQTEFLALQGMSKLVEVVQILRRRLNPELRITGILPCLYDSRLRLAREVLGEIRNYFHGQVLPHPIRSSVKLAEAPSFGKTIFEYAPGSPGAQDYARLAAEVLARETTAQAAAPIAAAPAPELSAKDVSPTNPPTATPRMPKRATPAAKLDEAPARKRATPSAPKRAAPAAKKRAETARPATPAVLHAGDVPPLPPDAFEILSILPGDP